MDDNEYLSIKYKIYLKNDETNSLSSSISSNQSNEQQQQQSSQTKSKQYRSSIRLSDQSVDTQQWQHSKYKAMPSSGQLNQAAIRTSSIETRTDSVHFSNKSSQTNYSRDIDPCMNCSKLLMSAAEFLTKIELNYDLTPTSSLYSYNQYTKSLERPSKNKRRFARRRADNVSNTPIPIFNDKAIPITSSSEALLIKHTNKSDQKLKSVQRKKADKSIIQNVSPVEEDIITPLDWMLSPKEKEKQKEFKGKFETDKCKNEKKAEADKVVKNEANIQSKLEESREKGQEKRQNVMAQNGLMTSDIATVDSAAAKKMQLESEKTAEPATVITSKMKDIAKSDKKTIYDDNIDNSYQKEVDKKVTNK